MADSRREFLRFAGLGVTGAALTPGPPSAAQAAISRSVRPKGIFVVTDFGAVGDGKTIDSPAINRALEAAAVHGGTVVFPAGTYASYSIRLKSNVALVLEQGAVLLAAEGPLYDVAEPDTPWNAFQDYGHNHWHNSLLWGEDVENISITGPGRIWGKGLVKDYGPPPNSTNPRAGNKSIALKNCHNVILRDISILEGGWFAVLATGVDNLTIDTLKIDTNRDGIDIDCCRNVHVSNCTISSPWDDAIVLKSSYALGTLRATENVTIANCYISGYWEIGSVLDGTWKKYPPDATIFRTGRIKFGSESNGGFINIAISNCALEGCGGLLLESVDGALCEDIAITNITMRNITVAPFFMRLGDRLRGPKATTKIGALRRVLIGNIVCWNTASTVCSIFSGIPGHELEDVTLHDVIIVCEGGGTADQKKIHLPEDASDFPEPTMFGATPAFGFYLRHIRGITMNNIAIRTIAADARPAFVLRDVEEARFFQIKAKPPGGAGPVFSLTSATDFSVRYSNGIPDTHLALAESTDLP